MYVATAGHGGEGPLRIVDDSAQRHGVPRWGDSVTSLAPQSASPGAERLASTGLRLCVPGSAQGVIHPEQANRYGAPGPELASSRSACVRP